MNTSVKNKIKSVQSRFFSAFLSIFLFFSCDGFEKDIDIEMASFPPKLSVTAILERHGDSGESTFTIHIAEGRSMADYAKGVPYERTIIAPGKISLIDLSNGETVFTHSGYFDLSTEFSIYVPPGWNPDWGDFHGWLSLSRIGYSYEHKGFVTYSERQYRIEVEVDGYPSVSANAIMPDVPAISATADTASLFRVNNTITTFSSLDGWYNYGGSNITADFTTVTLSLDERSSVRNFYALEFFENGATSGVYVRDLTAFPDNPEIEYFNEGISFDEGEMIVDLYSFPLFMMNENNFPRNNPTVTLHSAFYSGCPYPDEPQNEFSRCSQYELKLRVRCITAETFTYYRSMTLQSMGLDFFSEPINMTGNIEGGYGIFSAYNTKDIVLLDYSALKKWIMWDGY